MKACFPIQSAAGLDSVVYGHFGSAPSFMVVDTATGEVAEVINRDQHHAHGQCSPLRALDGVQVDCVVVGGIGAGALGKLTLAGIKVFKASAPSVGGNIELLRDGRLAEFSATHVCAGHSHG